MRRKKRKTAHRIDDRNGVIQQYPKKMRHPHRHGFVWDDDATNDYLPIHWEYWFSRTYHMKRYAKPVIVKLVYIDDKYRN